MLQSFSLPRPYTLRSARKEFCPLAQSRHEAPPQMLSSACRKPCKTLGSHRGPLHQRTSLRKDVFEKVEVPRPPQKSIVGVIPTPLECWGLLRQVLGFSSRLLA